MISSVYRCRQGGDSRTRSFAKIGRGMIYTVIFLLVFSLILLIADYKNKYSYLFVLMVVGMSISLFAVLMHISVLGNYVYDLGNIFSLDHKIFMYASREWKIPISSNARIINAGIALYLLSVPLFVHEFRKNSRNETIFYKSNLFKIAVLFLPPAFYLFVYDPSNALRLYYFYHHNKDFFAGRFAVTAVEALHLFNRAWILVYLFYPIYILFKYYRDTNIRYVKQQLFLLATGLAIMNALFFWVFFTGPFMMSTEKIFTSGFWIFENFQTVSYRYYAVIPLITLIVLQLTLVILLRLRMGSVVHFLVDRKIRRNLRRMNDLLSDILHSYKNVLFSINILAQQASRDFGNAGGEEALGRILAISSADLAKTSEMLDSLREIRYRFLKKSLCDAIDEAIKESFIPGNIELVWSPDEDTRRRALCRLDLYHMGKVFINIVKNSVEAIGLAGRTAGRIEIHVTFQFEWIVVVVSDNGTGIKDLIHKRLFTPYHSGKNGPENFGLGLSYVYKVVKAHLGYVWLETKFGEFTSVQIMLPGVT